VKYSLAIAILASTYAAAAPAAAPPGGDDYGERLAFIKAAGLDKYFSLVAVKANRPMPWPSFVDLRYREFKGPRPAAPGRSAVYKTNGDLGTDAAAAVWLAFLDDDYRRNGRLLFAAGGKMPWVPEDKWISLAEFEGRIMPRVANSPNALQNKDVENLTRGLVNRATDLHYLSPATMLLVPGEPAKGWRPLSPRDPAWRDVYELKRAYSARDGAAMRRYAAAAAIKLRAQPEYPSRTRLVLELLLNKTGVLKYGFVLYVVSALLLFLWAALGKKPLAAAGAWVAFAGFLLITAGLVARTIVAGYWPTTSMYEYLSLFSWAAVLFFLVFYARTRQALVGVVVMPVAFLLLVISSLFPSDIEGQLIPALQSWWLTIHVTLACLAEGAFAVGFGAAVLRLSTRDGAPSKYLPTREALSVLEYRAISIGYPLFTVGALVAGAIWAQKAWSVWWSWDPKETASLIVWFIATAYLHVRTMRGWKDARADVLAILIFVGAVLTLFANMIFGGLHSYGV